MRTFVFMFFLGVCALQAQATLPAPQRMLGVGFALTLLAALAFRLGWARGGSGRRLMGLGLAAAFAAGAGFVWAGLRAEWRLAEALPMSAEGRDVQLSGRVVGLPQRVDDGVRFVLAVDEAAANGGALALPERIQLSWYRGREEGAAAPRVDAGERWRLVVRLKRPHGFVNPDGFDYEAWLLERGVRATGYVRADVRNQRLDADGGGAMAAVHRLRAAIRERFHRALPDAPHAGILIALAIGDQRAIPDAQWELFRRTSIAHLVSISGLHISLVALLAGGCAGALWRRVPWLALRMPTAKLAALAAVAAGTAYALLAGMGIPVQRALVMLLVVAAALLHGREIVPSRVLALALGAVLVFDPWAVLAPGFWLSFCAVGTILFVIGGRVVPLAGWRSALRIQLAISLVSLPLLLAVFQSFSVVGPLANAIAIPLVSFVVTPLVLSALVLPAEWPLALAHLLTDWMMWVMAGLATPDFALWQQARPPLALALAGALATAVLLLPRPAPGKPVAVLVLVALLGWSPPRPPPGAFRLTVLDVGQGLAVHVQTATRDLLYDTGPPYGTGSDAGERVLVPYLRASGVRRLDRVVLSHDDSDHIGGTASVLDAVAVERIIAGEALRVNPLAAAPEACVRGERWVWDAVEFVVLGPEPAERTAPAHRRGNDDSCVLRVAAAGGAALLVGDIGARAEAALLAREGEALASAVIVVAHHGSRSSSSAAFVDAVRPEAAIFSAGYLNAFGHPHPAVWARWAEAGARNWRTDGQGAIRVEVGAAGVEIGAWRELAPRYWHGR